MYTHTHARAQPLLPSPAPAPLPSSPSQPPTEIAQEPRPEPTGPHRNAGSRASLPSLPRSLKEPSGIMKSGNPRTPPGLPKSSRNLSQSFTNLSEDPSVLPLTREKQNNHSKGVDGGRGGRHRPNVPRPKRINDIIKLLSPLLFCVCGGVEGLPLDVESLKNNSPTYTRGYVNRP